MCCNLYEVGNAFDHSLKIDKNGACFAVYPDCPPFESPDFTVPNLLVMTGFGQYLAAPLNFETFKGKSVLVGILIIFAIIYMLLSMLF